MQNNLVKTSCLMGYLFFLSCGSETESMGGFSEEENQIEDIELLDSIENEGIDDSTNDMSYAKLKADIDNNTWIKREYLQGASKYDIRGQLIYHKILIEADRYLFLSTGGECDAGVECYYLISFSTTDGQMISYIDLGQSAEGVSPDKFSWDSKNEFTTSSYSFELIENEEGFYEQGELLDSIITNYSIQENGEIVKKRLPV